MKAVVCWAVAATVMLVSVPAKAQTGDEVIEKHLAAIGGRAALGKLESRIARGTMSVSVTGPDGSAITLTGPVEVYSKAPNKLRTFARFDLSQMGAGELAVDQRFDGKAGFVSDTMRGDRDVTGSQLQSMVNSAPFPTPLLTYTKSGGKAELAGKDKLGDRPVYVVALTPKAGFASKNYFDAETYQLLRVVTRVDIPEMGGETEQTVDFSDFREVDGVKVPFGQNVTNSMQTIAIKMDTIEHNKPIDEAMFSKPVAK